jgi:hypothetical protein
MADKQGNIDLSTKDGIIMSIDRVVQNTKIYFDKNLTGEEKEAGLAAIKDFVDDLEKFDDVLKEEIESRGK